MGAKPFHIVVPTPRNRQIVPIRSTGASVAIQRLAPVVTALQQAGFVVDCTVEGLMHAVETPEILKAGARILNISNEHPEALERMVPDTALEKRVRAAVKMLRGTKRMRVTSKAGTELDVRHGRRLHGWGLGWTDKPGTLAHWPGGIVVSFPGAVTVNGTLVMAAGDINLTFKRYLTSRSDDAEDVTTSPILKRGRRRRCQIALEVRLMSPAAITSVPLTVPLLGKLTTMPPGQCASVPGLSVQPQTPTVEAPTMSTSSSVPALEVTRIRLVPRSIFTAARTRFSSAVSGTMRSSASGCSFDILRISPRLSGSPASPPRASALQRCNRRRSLPAATP